MAEAGPGSLSAAARILDAVLGPLDGVDPHLGLLAAAALSAAVGVLAVHWTVRPGRVAARRDRVLGELLGTILFRHDAVVIGRSLVRSGRATVAYLGLFARPFLVLVVPLGLLWGLLEARYGPAPFQAGDGLVVWLEGPAAAERPELVAAGGGLTVTTPAIATGPAGVAWRIEIARPGVHRLEVGRDALDVVARPGVPIARRRVASNDLLGRFLAPSGAALETPGARAISIDYPDRRLALGDRRQPWWVFYLLEVFLFGWAVAATFGVEV